MACSRDHAPPPPTLRPKSPSRAGGEQQPWKARWPETGRRRDFWLSCPTTPRVCSASGRLGIASSAPAGAADEGQDWLHGLTLSHSLEQSLVEARSHLFSSPSQLVFTRPESTAMHKSTGQVSRGGELRHSVLYDLAAAALLQPGHPPLSPKPMPC